MVKYCQNKPDIDLSTTHSTCSDTDTLQPETLTHIIDKMPKLTTHQRKQALRLNLYNKNSSRKWSQAETKQFYQLLRHYGLDFTVMSYHPFFINRRSQKELSNKYKKESKMNPVSMESILNKID